MRRQSAREVRTGPGGVFALRGPTLLAAAVSRALEKHPYAASGDIALDTSRVAVDAEALWSRLTALTGAAREHAVSKLAAHEYRLLIATAPSRLMNRSVRNVLGFALSLHPLPGAASLAWKAFLVGDGDDERLRNLAAPVPLAAGEAREAWSNILRGPSPSVVVIGMWQAAMGRARKWDRPRRFDEWVGQPDVVLDRYPLFLDVVRRRLLGNEYVGFLDQQEKSETIARWVAKLVPTKDRPSWYLAFLTETCPGQGRAGKRERWPVAHAVCEVIYRSMGAPDDGNAFWESAPADVAKAFELWLKDRELTDLLGGENDRVEFWRRYLIPMRRMERTRDRAVAFLYFNGWTAVQFVNAGHATFLCREKAVRGWTYLQEAEVYREALDLRNYGREGYLGSYEHRGFAATWQWTASRTVEAVFEVFRRSRASNGRQ